MDLDDDVYMRDGGPDSDPLEREDLEVQWKSSQTSNRALDSLMLEAAQNAHAVGRARGWSTHSPSPRAAASTSRTVSAPTLLFFDPHPPQPQPPASTPSTTAAAPSSRRRARATPRAASLSLSNGAGVNINMGTPTTDPAQFMKILVGVSKQANQNAGIPAPAGKRTRQGVKQSSKLVTNKTGTKGKEREHRAPLSRTSSSVSISPSSVSISPSSVSSPGSNYSFLSPSTSGSADTSITSPEREEAVRGSGPSRRAGKNEAEGLGLMPPPPVPQKQKHARLPALDVCVPSPGRSVKVEQSPEARLHPLLQQQQQKQAKGAPPLRNSSNAPAVRAAPPQHNTPMPAPAAPPTPTHTETQSQSQSQSQSQPAPPRPRASYLGMRRTHTAPSAGAAGAGGMSSSQSVRKFRPPLLNPEAALAAAAGGGAQVKTEGRVSAATNPPPAARTNPPPPARAPAPAVPVPVTPQSKPRQPQPASSPWSDTSFDEHNTSFDLEELEKVMREYDD